MARPSPAEDPSRARSHTDRAARGAGLMNRRALVGWVTAASLLAIATSFVQPARTRASVVQALSLEEMTHKAEVIVLGVATERQSRYGIDGKLIVTDVSMKVDTTLKGDVKAGQTLIATVLGGRIDDVALQVPGEANLPVGQRVIAFLYHAPASGDLRVVGMAQGVLALMQKDSTTMVLPGGNGAALMAPDAQGQMHEAQPALTQPTPLGELLDKIRAFVK